MKEEIACTFSIWNHQCQFKNVFLCWRGLYKLRYSGRDTPGGDGESDGDERVMCMACRGVYPSRRSLTGHIGRNEKCREIIGFLYFLSHYQILLNIWLFPKQRYIW